MVNRPLHVSVGQGPSLPVAGAFGDLPAAVRAATRPVTRFPYSRPVSGAGSGKHKSSSARRMRRVHEGARNDVGHQADRSVLGGADPDRSGGADRVHLVVVPDGAHRALLAVRVRLGRGSVSVSASSGNSGNTPSAGSGTATSGTPSTTSSSPATKTPQATQTVTDADGDTTQTVHAPTVRGATARPSRPPPRSPAAAARPDSRTRCSSTGLAAIVASAGSFFYRRRLNRHR